MRFFRILLTLLLAFLASRVEAQKPDAEWRTIETEHFRVHYPAEYGLWATEVAGKLEPIRDRLIVEIGFAPSGKTDVLVMDPFSQANGYAWPLLTSPRMVLWTSPPAPESTIGAYTSWIDLLAVHEYAHLVHILRPSRNPAQQLLERILPIGPIGLGAPRWVTEGYATVLEGDLTGSGRPNSDLRASILRLWAQSGRLPSYGQLKSDPQSWLGMSMAYLVGSAYLEWLREREGDASLRHLWARMTARDRRSFDEAFEGVFGDSPRRLYDRFTAEMTGEALVIEQTRAGSLREGELWQDLEWTTEPPGVTRDGKLLLTVMRKRDEPAELVVFSTGPDDEERQRRDSRIAKTLERDPYDVAPVQRGPVDRKPLHTLRARDATDDFESPRWRGTDAILFSRFEPDTGGVYHPDLFLWHPERERVTRLTRGADLRNADPSPDGTWAVAVRNRFGSSQLVSVDLTSGLVDEMTAPSVHEIVDAPRFSPDGHSIVYLRLRKGRWGLVLRDVSSAAERDLVVPGATIVAQPDWSADGRSVLVSAGRAGFIDIVRVPVDGAAPQDVTRSQGASMAPASAPDAMYFLALDADGFDIRRLSLESAMQPLPSLTLSENVWPLAGIRDRGREGLLRLAVDPERPYGFGRQEYSFLLGGNYAEATDMIEAGLRVGDVVGRFDALLVGSLGGSRGPRGAAAAAAWRGWPIEVSGSLFSAKEQLHGPLFEERTGAEIRGSWASVSRYRLTGIDAGVLVAEIGDETEDVVFAGLRQEIRWPRGEAFASGAFDTNAYHGWRDGGTWDRIHAMSALSAGLGDLALKISYARGFSSGEPGEPAFALGGLPSSIIPESAWSGRVLEPAVDIGTLSGPDYEAAAADLFLGELPVSLFFQRYRFWEGGGPQGDWFDLAGLRVVLESGPMPLLQIPPFGLELGVAQLLEEPLREKTRWWVGVVFRP